MKGRDIWGWSFVHRIKMKAVYDSAILEILERNLLRFHFQLSRKYSGSAGI